MSLATTGGPCRGGTVEGLRVWVCCFLLFGNAQRGVILWYGAPTSFWMKNQDNVSAWRTLLVVVEVEITRNWDAELAL